MNARKLCVPLFALCIVLANELAAQNHHVFGLFPTYHQYGKITERLDYSVYTFLAIYPTQQTTEGTEYPAKSNAAYAELAVNYHFTQKLSAAGSYTYERLNPFREDYRNEHRLWLQAQYYTGIGGVNIKNRVRYDFRFIEQRSSGQYLFGPRLRYLLGLDFPLNDKGTYLAAYNEFFFDTFSEKIQTYSENWAFAGIGFRLSDKITMETGPLIISWIRNANSDWLHQYFLQATLIVNLDLRK